MQILIAQLALSRLILGHISYKTQLEVDFNAALVDTAT